MDKSTVVFGCPCLIEYAATMLTLRAYAKINWHLRVLNKRPDGYHNIESVMQGIELHDEIALQESEGISLLVNPPMDLPLEDNLVYRAALRLQATSGSKRGALISLTKRIPSGAGLGGGSSDAASTMIGLNNLWGLNLSLETLIDTAASLGSDVPFFIDPSMAKVTGRGEIIHRLPISIQVPLLIVKPSVSISTKEAYAALKRDSDYKGLSNLSGFIEALRRLDFGEMARLGKNDFEDMAFARYPILREIKERLLNAGALYSLMSGSGSAIFGVFKTEKEALKAGPFEGCFVCLTNTC